MKILAAKKILKVNDQLAADNRAKLDAAGVFGVNVVGSPGSGKTTLLEALFAELHAGLKPAVIEGDIAGLIDAQRIEALGVPVAQYFHAEEIGARPRLPQRDLTETNRQRDLAGEPAGTAHQIEFDEARHGLRGDRLE